MCLLELPCTMGQPRLPPGGRASELSPGRRASVCEVAGLEDNGGATSAAIVPRPPGYDGGSVRRRLLNLLAIVSTLLVLAVVAIWVRSYWRDDVGGFEMGGVGAGAGSCRGPLPGAAFSLQGEPPGSPPPPRAGG